MITAAWYTAVSTPQHSTAVQSNAEVCMDRGDHAATLCQSDAVAEKPSRQLPPVKIYHSTTGGLNPFTWGEMEGVIMRSIKRNPFESCFRRPKCTLTKHELVYPLHFHFTDSCYSSSSSTFGKVAVALLLLLYIVDIKWSSEASIYINTSCASYLS